MHLRPCDVRDVTGYGACVRVTAKVDYAVRAAIVLAAAGRDGMGPVKGEVIAADQDIPARYLEGILAELRQAEIVRSRRGADGGYWLASAPDEVSMADLIRAVEGPLANVRGERPESLVYPAGTGSLQRVWIATRASMRRVLEVVTLQDVLDDTLPTGLDELVSDPEAWLPH